MGKCSIADLRMELFDTLQRLKSNNDKNCSANEKCSIEEAEAVCDIAKEITETFKVQVQAMAVMAKADNPSSVKALLLESGLGKAE